VSNEFPVAKLKFNLQGNILAVTSSHEVSVNIFSAINGKKIA